MMFRFDGRVDDRPGQKVGISFVAPLYMRPILGQRSRLWVARTLITLLFPHKRHIAKAGPCPVVLRAIITSSHHLTWYSDRCRYISKECHICLGSGLARAVGAAFYLCETGHSSLCDHRLDLGCWEEGGRQSASVQQIGGASGKACNIELSETRLAKALYFAGIAYWAGI